MKIFVFLVVLSILYSCEYKDISANMCNLSNVSFSKQVQPIITSRCATLQCHSPARASSLLTLHNYEEIVRDCVDVKRYIVSKKMPVGSPLSDCELKTIIKWLEQGAADN